ncbi:hypothetical protein E4191_00710 [Paracoccus liaowanqingii]|uniref:Tyr recombinase domain-containing protein n=1 Tax=Paracoccus liaowanqingii TaxID=2560053 RepID=A0A4P7HIF4_9RHOB|nr:tyrosine-type recombinase/integrase [Paracoccus liaowanqingii]QBX33400.1 hypothetical protein E4191_00710 [Paracoccus liaowanqingii]
MSKYVVVIRSKGPKPAQHGSYLEKRHNTYYATLKVPKGLRGIVGKSNMFLSLQTDSIKVAKIRVMSVVAEWKTLFESLKNNGDLINSAVQLQRLKEVNPYIDVDQLAMDAFTHRVQKDPKSEPVLDVITPQHGQALSVVVGESYPLSVHIPDYEKSLTYVEAKTRDMRVSDLHRFTKVFPTAESATNKAVREWVEQDLIAEKGLSTSTCKRLMTACRGFWSFLKDRKSLTLPHPFDGVVPPQNRVKTAKSIVADKRRQFLIGDYKRLLEAAEERKDANLCNLIRIAAHTGCRIEELCQIKTEQVQDDRLIIEDAKTPSGWREVPLHNRITDLVALLKEKSADGYLISGLSSNNKYKYRADAIGKRFSKLKVKLGYTDHYVFHSFRKSVSDQLEAAGIPENVSARIIGHEISTMTYGLYSSGGVTFETKKDAINKIKWD